MLKRSSHEKKIDGTSYTLVDISYSVVSPGFRGKMSKLLIYGRRGTAAYYKMAVILVESHANIFKN